MVTPKFTIGVTTFDRREMLKECLGSLLNQTFSDFEVIVGNDYTAEVLTKEALGIADDRIRIVNHSQNIGEIENMNFLLNEARGIYFSWLADDDLVSPYFLESLFKAISDSSEVSCVFCSYKAGEEYNLNSVSPENRHQLISGRKFLRHYLSRKINTIGCYGGFKTDYLRNIGGIRQLGDGFSPYSDNLLVVTAGVLDKIAFIESPIVFFRTHDESASFVSSRLESFISAQEDFLSSSMAILKTEKLYQDYKINIFLVLRWCSSDFYSVLRRGGAFQLGSLIGHYREIEKYARGAGINYIKFQFLQISLIMGYLAWRLRNTFSLN